MTRSASDSGPVPPRPADGGSSRVTVLVAFGANLLIAAAKSVAALVTGSASMAAEAAHSWADTGNEVLLLVAERRSVKRRDAAHPLGFGREAYVWSMFAAFGLFSAGAVVSVYHGIHELIHPEPAGAYGVAYAVLAIAFVLEGTSFRQALRQSRSAARELGLPLLRYLGRTSHPTLRAVFAEDAAALLGLLLAATGIGLHQLTGSVVPDAIGSVLVGLLLGVVAMFLLDRNRRFLVGERASPDLRARILNSLLQQPEVERVSYLHLEFVGPGRLFLVAAIDLTGNELENTLAVRLRRLERELEAGEHVERAVLTLATPEEPSLAS